MSITERIDVFHSVHKGLRKALYSLSLQAGITEAGQLEEMAALKSQALEVFHFLEHHARNEDRFLVPLMEAKSLVSAPDILAEHAELDAEVDRLRASLNHLDNSPTLLRSFYLSLNRFIAKYLAHLDKEETDILPLLHEAFTDTELSAFSQQSVAATTPQDQAMMLGHMFPAMQTSELRGFFNTVRTKAPEAALRHLEAIAHRVLGPRAGFLESSHS